MQKKGRDKGRMLNITKEMEGREEREREQKSKADQHCRKVAD